MSEKTGILCLKGRLGSVSNQVTNTFVQTPFLCNTSLFATFTEVATSYQRYKPHRMKLHASPLDKLQAGDAVLCFNPNPKATNPGTMTDVLSTSHRHLANAGDHLHLEVDFVLNVDWLNCRVSGSIDDLLEMFGVIWVCTDRTKAAYTATVPFIVEIELWVSFDEVTNANISPQLESLLLRGLNAEAAQLCLSYDKDKVTSKQLVSKPAVSVLSHQQKVFAKMSKKRKQKSSPEKGKK